MKRQEKKKGMGRAVPDPGGNTMASPSEEEGRSDRETKRKPSPVPAKREAEKKSDSGKSLSRMLTSSLQFLRESRTELKKVKWPTRKELLASTAVVIGLVLVISFFLGLIDFGLIKIIKNIVG
ncbi:MAG: preprotein translocase subunit SecE [Deltaproteobacteria bacterium]